MNQVTTKKEGALAVNMFEADANQGAQNIAQEDLALPFLKILGQLSPEVNKRDGKYVEGAEPGKIINTVTNELYDKLSVVPCHYKRQYIEWQDRGQSSGAPVAIHDADSDIISQTTRGKDYKDRLPNGNYLDNTANHFVLIVGDNPETWKVMDSSSFASKVGPGWTIIGSDDGLGEVNLIRGNSRSIDENLTIPFSTADQEGYAFEKSVSVGPVITISSGFTVTVTEGVTYEIL